MADRQAGRPQRAVIYARISRDAEGEKLGVGRQLADCRALAKSLGLTVIEEFTDNDISASTKSKKSRPAFAAMLALARSGQVDVILAYSNSRLTRRPLEVEDLIQLSERHGVRIKTIVSGDDDLSTADGRMVARIKGNVDAAEAERTAERTRRAKAEMASKGQWLGGRRPFGYEPGGMVIREREATVIRMATKGVIEGRSIRGLVKELNEKGSRTSTGRDWTDRQLRDVLLRPRNMGHTSHGQIGRADFEIGPRAQWPAIVDEDTWRAMHDVLMDSSRRTNPGGNDVNWLGSGIYRCGVCQKVLRSVKSGRYGKQHYICKESSHILIDQAKCDAYVIEQVTIALNKPSIIAALSPSSPNLGPDRERRSVLEARLASFESDYASGNITGAQLAKATSIVTAEIATLDEKLASSIRRSTASPVFRAGNPAARFAAAQLDVQRAVVDAICTVTVTTAAAAGIGPGQSFNTDRILVDFIDDEPDEGTPPTP